MPAAISCPVWAHQVLKLQVTVVKRTDDTKGFTVLPRRWVVERTLAWLTRNRRLAKDFEALVETAAAWLMLASVKLLLRKLARAYQPIGY